MTKKRIAAAAATLMLATGGAILFAGPAEAKKDTSWPTVVNPQLRDTTWPT